MRSGGLCCCPPWRSCCCRLPGCPRHPRQTGVSLRIRHSSSSACGAECLGASIPARTTRARLSRRLSTARAHPLRSITTMPSAAGARSETRVRAYSSIPSKMPFATAVSRFSMVASALTRASAGCGARTSLASLKPSSRYSTTRMKPAVDRRCFCNPA